MSKHAPILSPVDITVMLARANRHRELVQFILEASVALPLARRARIYRALAAITPDDTERAELIKTALQLEACEVNFNQLQLHFNKL